MCAGRIASAEFQTAKLGVRPNASCAITSDIRAFHSAILNDGPMPLSILEEKIDRWIVTEKAG
jgi:uncharacterized protein (DUF885 family)